MSLHHFARLEREPLLTPPSTPMNNVSYRVPATDQPDPDAMTPRPALASLTKQKRVKLRLSEWAFAEACQVFAALSQELGKDVEQQPWLDRHSSHSRKALALLADIYESQMQPVALAQPALVTLTLSRCEAYQLWELWDLMEANPAQVPAYMAVMHELHHLLS